MSRYLQNNIVILVDDKTKFSCQMPYGLWLETICEFHKSVYVRIEPNREGELRELWKCSACNLTEWRPIRNAFE